MARYLESRSDFQFRKLLEFHQQFYVPPSQIKNSCSRNTEEERPLRLWLSYNFIYSVYINMSKIQQDTTVCRYLFTAESLSTYFGFPSHPSSGVRKTVTAASGTGHSSGVPMNFVRGGVQQIPLRTERTGICER